MIKVLLAALMIYFAVVLYGECRHGHWHDAPWTVISMMLIYAIWRIQ